MVRVADAGFCPLTLLCTTTFHYCAKQYLPFLCSAGDYDFWRDTVSTYVECRLAAPHTTTTDAREGLQGGIQMFTIIAR